MPISLDGTNGVTTPNATVSTLLTVAGGTVQPLVLATAQNSTSGTSIDFTGIPSWARRITIAFNGVSTNGTSNLLIQVGAGSVATTGYSSTGMFIVSGGATGGSTFTAGFGIAAATATNVLTGTNVLTLQNGSTNSWVMSGFITTSNASAAWIQNGVVSLSGALDRVRITTVNGTDAFDAGSINILYE